MEGVGAGHEGGGGEGEGRKGVVGARMTGVEGDLEVRRSRDTEGCVVIWKDEVNYGGTMREYKNVERRGWT